MPVSSAAGAPVAAARPTLRVSVVVCTAGRRPAELQACVRSLATQTVPPDEVIVVANAVRGPLTMLSCDELRLRIVQEPRRGLDLARDRGIAESTGDVVAFIDDDCEADPGWVAGLHVGFADPGVGMMTGRVLAAALEAPTQLWFERRYSFDRGSVPLSFPGLHAADRWFPAHPYHVGTGANMAFRRAVLSEVGPFDPALDMGTWVGGGGDLDMFARVLDRGTRAVYRPDALVRHHHRGRRRQLVKQFVGYGASVSSLCVKGMLTRPSYRRRTGRFLVWYVGDSARRLVSRLPRGTELPAYLYLAELVGLVWGPVGYITYRWWGRLRR